MRTALWIVLASFLIGCPGGVRVDEAHLDDAAKRIDAEIERAGLVFQDPELDRYLAGVVAALPSTSRTPVRLRVVRDPTVNAFALPNGSIWLTAGLFGQMQDEAQLALVIAHERAHIEHGHALAALRGRRRTKIVTQLAGLVVAPIGWADPIAGGLYGVVVAGYSREQEMEADRDATTTVVSAGYPLASIPGFFEAVDRLGDGRRGPYADHPSMVARKRAFEAFVTSRSSPPAPSRSAHAEAFQRATRSVRRESVRLCLDWGPAGRAMSETERLLAENPNDAAMLAARGDAFRLTSAENPKQLDEAVEAYTRATTIDPSLPAAHRGLGYVAILRDDHEGARQHLERYLVLAPQATDRRFVTALLERMKQEKDKVKKP